MAVTSISGAVEFRLVVIQVLTSFRVLHPYVSLINVGLTVHKGSSRAEILLAYLFEWISLTVRGVMVIFRLIT